MYNHKTTEDLRKDLIEDCYAAAFGGGFGAALMEVPDIEKMSDAEVRELARARGFV